MSNRSTALPTLFLIDCMSLVFQAFYAVRGLTNAEGMPTNAVYGFVRQLQKFLATYEPTHVVAVFDSKGKNFRHELYEAYKANRVSPPDEFNVQLPYIFKAIDAMGIPTCSLSGYEADDLIGCLSQRAAAQGMRTIIVSADKDLFQLVNDHVSVLRSRKDDMEIYGPDEVKVRMGVRPDQIVDYLALVGDTSDNIPGIPGIGPKTATALLEQFGSLDNLLAHLDEIKNEKRRAVIAENKETVLLSRKLAQIECQPPFDMTIDATVCHPSMSSPALIDLYRELGFHSLLKAAQEAAPAEQQPEEKPAPAAPRKVDYRTVTDKTMLNRLVRSIQQAGRVAFDTETDAVDTMRARLVGMSFCCRPGTAWYIPVGHRIEADMLGDPIGQLPLAEVSEALSGVMGDEKIAKIAHNAKFDMRMLERHGIHVRGLTFDTMLASYLLNPEGAHGLKSMAAEVLRVDMTEIGELIGKGKSAITMAEVDIERAAPYACADADMTLQLADILSERLKSNGLVPLFERIEMPLVEVLDAMEAEGVTIDPTVLPALTKEIQSKTDEVMAGIFREVGHEFNVNSPKQVGEVLFGELGLKPQGKGAKSDSTSMEVLEELAKLNPVAGLILDFRHLDKIRSTYAVALPQMVNPETGRIHTSYNQFIAATGRLSSSSPNLQNIPIRTPLGRQIRRAFVPNEKGHVFLAADYSQIELRILAHVSGDEALRQAFVNNVDIHAQTAARIFGIPIQMVTDDMRSQAKVINFGILYGMSAHRLSRELGIPFAQAQQFIRDYFGVYPRVRAWMDELLAKARERGYVTTLTGRRRMVPNLRSTNRNLVSNAERMAINMPIQGTSADMIKIAMIALHREIRESARRARMVLQVHDELVFSLPESEVAEFEPVVRRMMEEAMPLEVPVRVDVKVGKTWAEC